MRKNGGGHRLAVAVAFAAWLFVAGWWALQVGAAPVLPPVAEIAQTAPGRLVIAVAPGYDEPDLAALLARSGARLKQWLPSLGLALVATPVGGELRAAELLIAEPAVQFVAAHRNLASIAETPSDPYWSQQWGPARTRAPAAWDLAWGDLSIVIAIADSGVLQDHWDLRDHTWYNPGESGVDPTTGRRTCDASIARNGLDDDKNGYVDDCRGWDFVAGDNNPRDEHGHGTAIAGIAGAATNNSSPDTQGAHEGIAGMCQASLMALRVLGTDGTGSAFDIAAAIDYAAMQGAQVINLSLTFPPTMSADSPDIVMLRRAVERAQAAGALIVGASGNQDYRGISFPARFDGVLAVGASNQQDRRAIFTGGTGSNWGERLDLVAPGVSIFSTLRQPGLHSYGYFGGVGSGTSFAAPHVSGAAALVRGLRPDLSAATVYELIRRTADDADAPGFDEQTGWGRLNVHRALAEAIPGLRVALAAVPPSIRAGEQAAIRVEILAPAGGPAGLGARVALTSSLGATAPITVTADSQGQATVTFVAGRVTGGAAVTATLGPVTTSLPVTITSGEPAGLALIAAPSDIAGVGSQALVTATVYDESGAAVFDGHEVAFDATLGTVSPITATTRNGLAGAVFTSGALSGTAIVRAAVAGFTATAPILILRPGAPYSMTLRTSPLRVAARGRVELLADVRDSLGGPAADGLQVRFGASRGEVSEPVVSTLNGLAVTWLTAPPEAGRITINAVLLDDDASAEAAVDVMRTTYMPLFWQWLSPSSYQEAEDQAPQDVQREQCDDGRDIKPTDRGDDSTQRPEEDIRETAHRSQEVIAPVGQVDAQRHDPASDDINEDGDRDHFEQDVDDSVEQQVHLLASSPRAFERW